MKSFILSLTFLFIGVGSFAQQKITEGTVTYSVTYVLPDNLKPYAAYFPKEAVVYFKGDSTLSVQKSTSSTTSVITNWNTSFMRLLMDTQGKQYIVSFSPADLEEIEMSKPEYEFTATGETQTIAGYKATKYRLKAKDGALTEAWFTKDIAIPRNSLSSFYDESHGVPLIFSTYQNGMVVNSTVKEIKAVAVPAGTFATPKGYQPLTLQQFKAMRGGE